MNPFSIACYLTITGHHGDGWRVSLSVNLAVPNLKTYAYKDGPHSCSPWYVIEHNTGLSMGSGKTRKAACENATNKIIANADRVQSLIDHHVRNFGQTNWEGQEANIECDSLIDDRSSSEIREISHNGDL